MPAHGNQPVIADQNAPSLSGSALSSVSAAIGETETEMEPGRWGSGRGHVREAQVEEDFVGQVQPGLDEVRLAGDHLGA